MVQLFVVGSIVFFLVRLIPGDPARASLGDSASDEQVAAAREAMHLNEPVAEQYLGFWGRLLTGDLGTSLLSGRPVMADLPSRLMNSLELVLLALAIAVVVGVLLGRIAATRVDRPADHLLVGGSIVGISLPVFVVGTLLLLVFTFWIPILPPRRFVTPWADPLGHLQILILPVITLAAAACAVITRMTRAAMLETLSADYVRTARAKGVAEKFVVRRHALRTALVPVVAITTVGAHDTDRRHGPRGDDLRLAGNQFAADERGWAARLSGHPGGGARHSHHRYRGQSDRRSSRADP